MQITNQWGDTPVGIFKQCGQIAAIPFWLANMVMMNLIMTNMFIAVVIEGFSESMKDSKRCINTESWENFRDK